MFDGWMKMHDKESTVWPSIVTEGFKASTKEKNSTRYKYYKIDKPRLHTFSLNVMNFNEKSINCEMPILFFTPISTLSPSTTSDGRHSELTLFITLA